jgi:hypothetical protein
MRASTFVAALAASLPAVRARAVGSRDLSISPTAPEVLAPLAAAHPIVRVEEASLAAAAKRPLSPPEASPKVKDPATMEHISQAEWDLFNRAAILSRAAFLTCPNPAGTVKVKDFKEQTHGYVSIDTPRKEIEVVMRGTMSLHDAKVDIEFLPAPYDIPGSEGCEGCTLHKAIQAVTRAVMPGILETVADLKTKNPDFKILVTGHSLGGMSCPHNVHYTKARLTASLGATCSLIALALRRKYGEVVTGVCMGSPRVGDPKFSKFFESYWTPGSYYRVTHWKDGVPQLPPAFTGFRHAGREYWISKETPTGPQDVVACDGNEDINCDRQFPTLIFNAINKSHLHYMVNFLTPKCGLT